MKLSKYLYILSFCFLLSTSSYGKLPDTLAVADVLQSNMVIQQNQPLNVWGWAKPGQQVSIKADWMSTPITTVANAKGEYLALIDVPVAKRGNFDTHLIEVTTNQQSIKLVNLLIGDVWLCSGQSNMQFAVKDMLGADEAIAGANQPHIRLLNVDLNFSAQPIENFSGKWQECSATNVVKFSAVGYSFGKKLYDELNIPIGIVFSGIGASGVQAYLPQEELANHPLLNSTYLQPYLESPKSKEIVNGGFSFEKVVRPFLLYNAMIHPLTKLSLKGFCWYQGEANHFERESYVKATQTMITAWRKAFKQGDLPFYYVQIAPFFHEKENPTLAYDAFFRAAQEKVADLNNTAMVVTMDVGAAKDLHPKNKKPIGERLAATALNRTYAQLEVPYRGPEFNYVTFDKKKAILSFKPETLGTGLNTRDGEVPKFFYLAGDDQLFYPATAAIVGDQVVVESKQVKQPKAVRYAFFNYPVTNLQNKEGFPVLPFRTDQWEELKELVK